MIARIKATALSKEATVPEFTFLAAFRNTLFAYGSLGFVFVTLGLFLALLLFIRLIVSNTLLNDLIIFVGYFVFLTSVH